MIGGGIHGVAVARDAALRGLRVLLAEQGDLASGTSSRTSKLVHGGIRYLETAQFGLVSEALRERSILLRTAPAFVRPVSFLLPHYRDSGRPRSWIRLGLWLYSFFARDAAPDLRAHRSASPREALALEPGLEPTGLDGASLFSDAQMEDARLCVALALDAVRSGLELLTHTAVVGLDRDGGAWRARLRSAIDGSDREERARLLINAAGPWADDVERLAGSARTRVRRTRGTHVVLPSLTRGSALLLTARRDGRVFFVLPWGDHSLLGTTDVDDERAPERVMPFAADIRYLLDEAVQVLPAIRGVRPVRAFAGVRSLVRTGAARPWTNAREHRIVRGPGRLALIGGKYTTHRSLAERVTDEAVATLGVPARPCDTARRPVPGDRDGRIEGLRAAHPVRLDLPGGLALEEAEVALAVREERALRLDDLLLRRTRLWLDGRALRAAAGPAARWMAAHLGWTESRTRDEVCRITTMLDGEDQAIEEAMR